MSEEQAKKIRWLNKQISKNYQDIKRLKQELMDICDHSRSTYIGVYAGGKIGYECNECGAWARWGFTNSKVTGRYG